MSRGLVHFYYGDGKGKTTAALGLALRALGSGKRVVLLQFLKGAQSGELAALKLHSGATVLRGKATERFTFEMNEQQRRETKTIHDDNLALALKLVNGGECDMLILDEAGSALQTGLLDEEMLREVVQKKPEALELVLTGHKPVDWIIKAADYVTEMKKHKHPFDSGTPAREGVEF